jgi:hypothetical protein
MMKNLLSSDLLTKGLNVEKYINIFFTIVLYEYETWSLALTGERNLRVSQNCVLRRILWPKREEKTI